MSANRTLLPFAMTVAGIAIFSAMDAVMKGAALAAGVYTAVFLRNSLGAAMMTPVWLAAGRPLAGRAALRTYGCSSCHHIPGVAGADSYVAPPLDGWAERSYIAGTLPNEPAHLIRWIRFPQAVEPGTAMPNLGVSAEDAAHISAYLYTLRSRPTWVEKVARALR